jgi:hypothetical protein
MSIKLMTAVWEREDLSPTHKLVLLALADWANDEGLCWPSINRLSTKTSMTSRGVQKTIRTLEKMGFVRREESLGKGNRYWISIPLNNVHPCTTFTPPLNHVHPTPEPRSPNTSETHQLTVNDIKPRAKRSYKMQWEKAGLPDWIPQEAWDGWIEMRNQSKKPLTARAVARAIQRLMQFRDKGQDLTEVLDRSTINGWLDVYEIREQNNGNQNRGGSPDRRSSLARAIDEGLDFLG